MCHSRYVLLYIIKYLRNIKIFWTAFGARISRVKHKNTMILKLRIHLRNLREVGIRKFPSDWIKAAYGIWYCTNSNAVGMCTHCKSCCSGFDYNWNLQPTITIVSSYFMTRTIGRSEGTCQVNKRSRVNYLRICDKNSTLTHLATNLSHLAKPNIIIHLTSQ